MPGRGIRAWTTQYIDAAVEQLRAEGHEIRDEDVAGLSPLNHKDLNVLGRYRFTTSIPATGALRPLRNPDAPELDEDGAALDPQRAAAALVQGRVVDPSMRSR